MNNSGIPPKKKLKQMSLINMFEAKSGKMEEIKKEKNSHHSSINMKCSKISSEEKSDIGGLNSKVKDKKLDDAGKKLSASKSSIAKKNIDVPCSPDMFESQDKSSKTISWRGSSLSEFTRLSQKNLNIPSVTPSPIHEVYIKCPILENIDPTPWPIDYNDVWDSRHVRMPNSPQSLYPNPECRGSSGVIQRWSLICQAFEQEITSIDMLKEAILSYNVKNRSKWTFAGLKYLVEKEFCEEEQDVFFSTILPGIIKLALSLPQNVTRPIRLLNKYTTRSITLSQKQISCLLANAFLCTYPRRNAKGPQSEYSSYPDINFNRLFLHKEQRGLEKLKCLIHYFKEVIKGPDGVVTFSRQSYDKMPLFESSRKLLKRLHIDSNGLIEDEKGLLQVDFANKYIGGGVLGLGCVQEEIRFVLCSELIVSRLFTEVLDKKEVLIITGVEQYSTFSGYASSFEWTGPYYDVTLRDPYRRKLCQVVALDALHFSRDPKMQFNSTQIVRELYKAYCGFCPLEGSNGEAIGVATGNWGCGAFKGDAKLKSLIQIIAASMVNRDIAYFSFGDEELRDDLSDMHEFLVDNGINIGELTMALIQYGKSTSSPSGAGLFQYIYRNITVYGGNTSSSDNSNPPFNQDNESQTIEKSLHSIKEYFKTKPSNESFKNNHSSDSDKKNDSLVSESGIIKNKKPLTDEKLLTALDECDKLVGSKMKNKSDSLLTKECDNGVSESSERNSLKNSNNTHSLVSDSGGGGHLFSILDQLEK